MRLVRVRDREPCSRRGCRLDGRERRRSSSIGRGAEGALEVSGRRVHLPAAARVAARACEDSAARDGTAGSPAEAHPRDEVRGQDVFGRQERFECGACLKKRKKRINL